MCFTPFPNTTKMFKFTDTFRRRFPTLFAVFGIVVKRGLSSLIFTTKITHKMLNFCLVHAYWPFARSGHVVPNQTSWDSSCTVVLPKQSNSYRSSLSQCRKSTPYCRFSHDVTKIQTTKSILLIFYLNEL